MGRRCTWLRSEALSVSFERTFIAYLESAGIRDKEKRVLGLTVQEWRNTCTVIDGPCFYGSKGVRVTGKSRNMVLTSYVYVYG